MTQGTHFKLIVIQSPVEATIGCDPKQDLVDRARAFHLNLLREDYDVIAVLTSSGDIGPAIARLQPDVIILDVGNDGDAVIQQLMSSIGETPLPVICFSTDAGPEKMRASLQAGVAAYVVANLSAERVSSVLPVAMARFHVNQKLRSELFELKRKLAAARALSASSKDLAERQRRSEDEAYRMLRSLATDKNLTLSDVAQRMLEVADLLM